MANVLEVYTTEKQSSVECVLWAKELNGSMLRIFIKEIFPLYGGKFFFFAQSGS
jgi:hypothetical protein